MGAPGIPCTANERTYITCEKGGKNHPQKKKIQYEHGEGSVPNTSELQNEKSDSELDPSDRGGKSKPQFNQMNRLQQEKKGRLSLA